MTGLQIMFFAFDLSNAKHVTMTSQTKYLEIHGDVCNPQTLRLSNFGPASGYLRPINPDENILTKNIVQSSSPSLDNMAVPSKSALSLLKDYDDSSESSGEEVIESGISSKRSASKEWFRSENKRWNKDDRARLPLPSVLKLSRDPQDIPEDDPVLHEGRVRSFPHERGNWSTYIYIPYEMTPSVEAFMDVVLSRMGDINIKPISDFHISLTRTVVLRHHWIDLFIKSIQECSKAIPRFQISFGSVKVYCNEERTRTFVGLEVSEGLEILKKSIKLFDKCLAEFSLPPYYQDPSFHLTIGWVIGDAEEQMMTILPQLDVTFKQCIFANAAHWTFPVTQFLCKSGNKFFSFQLVS